MKFELLDLLSKATAIVGICVGIFFITMSKILRIEFLKLFPEKTAAIMFILTLALPWSLAGLGLLVWVNSDMQTYIAISKDSTPCIGYESSTSLETRSITYAESEVQHDAEKNINVSDKYNKNNGYKSTSIMSSKTSIETKKKNIENEDEKNKKLRIQIMASSISILFLNAIFTIFFTISLIWVFFISSCLYYNKHYVSKIKK